MFTIDNFLEFLVQEKWVLFSLWLINAIRSHAIKLGFKIVILDFSTASGSEYQELGISLPWTFVLSSLAKNFTTRYLLHLKLCRSNQICDILKIDFSAVWSWRIKFNSKNSETTRWTILRGLWDVARVLSFRSSLFVCQVVARTVYAWPLPEIQCLSSLRLISKVLETGSKDTCSYLYLIILWMGTKIKFDFTFRWGDCAGDHKTEEWSGGDGPWPPSLQSCLPVPRKHPRWKT